MMRAVMRAHLVQNCVRGCDEGGRQFEAPQGHATGNRSSGAAAAVSITCSEHALKVAWAVAVKPKG